MFDKLLYRFGLKTLFIHFILVVDGKSILEFIPDISARGQDRESRERTMSMTEAGPAPGPDSEAGGAGRAFVCGVVEGFYGRPWTLGQRKDLFDKMEAWGMTR